MKKQLSAFLCACILCAGFAASGCGYKSYDMTKNAGVADSGSASAETAQAAGVLEYDSTMQEYDSGTQTSGSTWDESNGAMDDAAESETSPASRKQNEKLIYTYHYSVETKEFDSLTEKVAAKTAQLDGYVESSETQGSASDGVNRYANMTLRIPADKINQILSMLKKESNVTYSSSSIDNVTLQYVDLESHIKSLRTEQKTLLKLIEQADKLKDIIELQSQLTQVRYEIESYESQLRTYDNLVDYSTIHLSIQEVERTTTVTPVRAGFWEETKNKFSDNLYAIGQWLRALAVWLISSLPILLPLAIAAVIVIALVRRWAKHHRKHAPAPDRQAASGGYQSIYEKKQGNKQDKKSAKDSSQTSAVQESDGQDSCMDDADSQAGADGSD